MAFLRRLTTRHRRPVFIEHRSRVSTGLRFKLRTLLRGQALSQAKDVPQSASLKISIQLRGGKVRPFSKKHESQYNRVSYAQDAEVPANLIVSGITHLCRPQQIRPCHQ